MSTTSDSIMTIEKELLDAINFPQREVLLEEKQISLREYNAKRAIRLGNLFKDKVKVIFEDTEGMKMIQTTVWGMTERYLIFKRGMVIPLNRIHEIII
jgi:hypothetical protein